MNSVSVFLDGELIKVYIPLITGIVVFVITSVYNHWRDRVQTKKEKRVFFDDTYLIRNYSDLLRGKGSTPGKFLADGNFDEFQKMSQDSDFKLLAHIIKNIGDYTVFEITIKYQLYAGEKIYKFFRSTN
ncbi:hypothetical protein [Sporosarcina sp. Te-1]|uniref:hypothetical protein n=1 Tax=Sporosarcina sp. Te-1 TaxID=2818390 RepID=UPI001A9E86DD|nr:hypothetical protein [Sporosarcina sp. Te-1]QTD41959.1 hypothetical protein J3U78_03685 [Sporosarcina sp. Te-1]